MVGVPRVQGRPSTTGGTPRTSRIRPTQRVTPFGEPYQRRAGGDGRRKKHTYMQREGAGGVWDAGQRDSAIRTSPGALPTTGTHTGHKYAPAGHRASPTATMHRRDSQKQHDHPHSKTATQPHAGRRAKKKKKGHAKNAPADSSRLAHSPMRPARPRPAPQRVPGPTPPTGSRKRACAAGACGRRGTVATHRVGAGSTCSASAATRGRMRARSRREGGGAGGDGKRHDHQRRRAPRRGAGARCARWPRARGWAG